MGFVTQLTTLENLKPKKGADMKRKRKKTTKKKHRFKKATDRVEIIEEFDFGEFNLVVSKSKISGDWKGEITVMEVSPHGVVDAQPLWKVWRTYKDDEANRIRAAIVTDQRKQITAALRDEIVIATENRLKEVERQLGEIPGWIFDEPKTKRWWEFWRRT